MDAVLAISLFAMAMTITPGPNNIMILSSAMHYGVRRSLAHFLGICIGFPLMLLVLGLSAGSVLQHYPLLHTLVTVVGVAYLLWLAFLIALTQPRQIEAGNSKPMSFWQALLFQWVNPKAWMGVTSAMALFVAGDQPLLRQVALLTVVFFVVELPCVGVWLLFGNGLRRVLKSTLQQRMFNGVMALLLVLSLLPVFRQWLA